MKSRILAFILLIGLGSLGFSASAFAANDAVALRSLNKLSILLDKSTMTYQMFKMDSGNPIYSKAMDKTMERIRKLHDDYQQAAIQAKQQKEVDGLNKDVTTFLDELNHNEQKIAQGSYEEYAVVSDMYSNKSAAQDSITKLYSAIETNSGTKVEAAVQETRDLASLLQTMTASYIEQASSVSGSAMRAGGNRPLDQMAHDFSTRLAKFNVQSDKVIGLDTKVLEVKNKWAFIESSMINFKQNTVPYLVYRYADTMVDDLLDIGEMYETRNDAPIAAPTFNAPAADSSTPLPPGVPAAPATSEATTPNGIPLPPGVPPAKH